MKEYYNNCPYVCYSRAIGFMSKEPVPTCRRFYSNYIDNALRGTFEKCCDIALSGKCLIPGAKEYEQHKTRMSIKRKIMRLMDIQMNLQKSLQVRQELKLDLRKQ